MTREQIDALVRGATLYHRLAENSPQGEGMAVFHFGLDGRAVAMLPSGAKMVGDWAVEDGGYVMKWDGSPQHSSSTLTKEDGALVCRNRSDGSIRSTVEKLIFGDPESLAAHTAT